MQSVYFKLKHKNPQDKMHLRCFVEGDVARRRIEPDTGGQLDVVGGPVHPCINGGFFLHGSSAESSVTSDSGDVLCHGMTAENGASVGELKQRKLSHRALASVGEIRVHVDTHAVVLGGNEDGEGTEGRLRREQCVRRKSGHDEGIGLLLLLQTTKRTTRIEVHAKE